MIQDWHRLVRLCAYMTRDYELAEDLAQETLLIGWQQQHRLVDRTRHTQWLEGIARNLCRSWWRRTELVSRSMPMTCDAHESIADAFDL